VGEDGALLRKQSGAEGSKLAEVGDVLVVELAGEGDDGQLDLGDGRVPGCAGGVEVADLRDTPEEVDGGGAGCGEGLADGVDFFVEFGYRLGFAAIDAEGYAHSGRDADGHGAADDHVLDDGGDLGVVSGEDVSLLKGELGLVEEVDAFGKPF
jgi:hypothetical protein